METGVLQLQVRSCGTAFQLNCDKLTLAFNDLTLLFGCWDRGTLWLTVKAAPHKFSYLLNYLQDDSMVANYLSLVNGKQEIFTAIW